MSTNPKVTTAILLIKRGSPVPVDLHTNLLSEGIDVEALIQKYTK